MGEIGLWTGEIGLQTGEIAEKTIFAADEAELAADGTVDVQIVTDELLLRQLIRKITSHSLSVFNSRDNSQKIRIQPERTKNRQQFLSCSIIILAVHVFFSFVWKIEINY